MTKKHFGMIFIVIGVIYTTVVLLEDGFFNFLLPIALFPWGILWISGKDRNEKVVKKKGSN